MTRTPASALLALTGVWVRSAQTRRAVVILTTVFALITSVTLSVAALTLTRAQQQDRDFGRYHQTSYLSMTLGALKPGTTDRIRTAVTSVAPESAVWIGSNTLRPDSYPKFFFQAPTATVQYLEGIDPRQAYPGRYRLESGRWPTSPRETVVSPHLLEVLGDHDGFTVLSGHARLKIVGTAVDRYATAGDLILAGAGTWESLKPLPAARQYQPLEGQLTVAWNPPANGKQATATVTANLPRALLDQGAADALTSNLSKRSDPPSTDGSSSEGLVSPVPLLLIVLLVAVLAVAASRRGNSTAASTLTAVGVRQRTVMATQVLAALATSTVAAIAGLTLGWLVTALIRTVVLTQAATQPLAPAGLPGPQLVLIAAAGVAAVTIGTLLPTRSGPARPQARGLTVARRVGRWLLAALALVVGSTRTDTASAYLLLVGLLLLGPDLLHLLRALLPRTRPRGLVTRGLMSAATGRQSAAVLVIGACLAVPLLLATQLASKQASDASYTFSKVPAGQIWVERGGDTGDIRGVAHALGTIPGFPAPVAARDLAAPPNSDGSAGAQATFPRTVTGGVTILVVPSSDALHRLLGDALPATAQATLDRGGVLDFLTNHGPQRLAVYADGGQLQTTTDPLPTQHIALGREWRNPFAGAILTRTARALHLPLSAPGRYFFYPDVTQAQIQQAVDATTRAGYDSDFVQYTVPPPPPVLPVTALVFFAGLVLAGIAVLLLTITDQTRRLRTSSSTLIAIGLSPAWTRSLLTLQTVLITTAGLVTGLAAGLVALHHATRASPVTVVPLLPAAVSGAATVLAALLVTLLAARNLTARSEQR